MKKTTIIGISGGSGSGKTTLARQLCKNWGTENVGVLYQDSYYRDLSGEFDHDGGNVNFDHPSSIDFELMAEDLCRLKEGEDLNLPIYDFASHKRMTGKQPFENKSIVLVDGILIFTQKEILEILDFKVFVDTPEGVRLERRIERDVNERGRTREGVLAQFYNHVKPMHDKYIEPAKKESSLILSGLDPVKDLAQSVNKSCALL